MDHGPSTIDHRTNSLENRLPSIVHGPVFNRLLSIVNGPLLDRLLSIVYRLASIVHVPITHMSFLIPAKRLRESATLLAFHHPKPSHPFHVILLPKKEIRSFADLEPGDPFLADLIQAVQSIVSEYHLSAYRLIVNGGEYQQFPHLHFHLISDNERSNVQTCKRANV
jgi:histidine triad (HIT) family protein